MNSAGDTFGVLYGKRFGSQMAWAIRKEGDRVGGQVRVKKQAVKGPGLHNLFIIIIIILQKFGSNFLGIVKK